VWAIFSAPFHAGPGAHLASYTMGNGPFCAVKWPGLGIDHQPPSSADVKENVELYLYSPLWVFAVCSSVNFNFTLPFFKKFFDVSNWKLPNFKQKL
jgi:hypothetical protein